MFHPTHFGAIFTGYIAQPTISEQRKTKWSFEIKD